MTAEERKRQVERTGVYLVYLPIDPDLVNKSEGAK